ncbi:MAG TPA: MFS transporter [Sphingobium sp.]|nr:MFS transporter [Sphingobium sp.]
MLTTSEGKIDRRAWWMLIVLTAIYTYSWLDRQIIVMLVDPIRHELGLTDFEMSLILGPAFGLCYVAFGIPLGWAADRFDRRWVIFGGILVWSAATTASGLATGFATLFFMRMLVAVGEAALTPAAHSMLTSSFPRKRLNTAMAIYSSSPKIGTSAAYALGGILITALAVSGTHHFSFLGDLTPWRQVFLVVGLPGLLMAFLVFTFREPARAAPRPGATNGGFIAFMLTEKRLFVPLLLGFCCVSIPSIALQTWVPTYMGRHFGWSPAQYGPVIGLISFLSAFAVVLKGAVVDWLYARGIRDAVLRFYTWLLAIFTPLAALAFLIENPLWFLIAYGFVQVVAIPFGLYMATSVQMVTPPHLRARASATALLAGNIASMTFGPTLVALLTNYVFEDPGKLGWSLAIVAFCGMGGAFVMLRYALRAFGPMLRRLEREAAAAAAETAA